MLFCVSLLFLLGGFGMILHSIQEDNRQYSEDHTEMDYLLEELQQPLDQTPLECEDAEILPAPADTPDHPMLIQQSKADERIEPEEQDSTMIVSSIFFPPEETSSPTETDSPPEAKNRDAAPQQDAKAESGIVNQPLSSDHLIGKNTGVDLTAAHEKNGDFVAWLKIPGTNVNYPVVLSDDTDYYLTHSFTGKQSKLRLAVYIKGKNAKKFRKNIEYGSARWGTPEDIAPFMDPVFRNNIILTQTERLMMSNRPKNPAYARNEARYRTMIVEPII